MEIGILSDTHNHIENLQRALNHLRARKIDTLIHCGDLTTVETARELAGFCVYYAQGNNDFAFGDIRQTLLENCPGSSASVVFSGEIDGLRVAAHHGHIPGKLNELINSKRYDMVFCGHTHEARDQMINGVRLVNPGALGSIRRGPFTFCTLDTRAREFDWTVLD